MNKTEVRAILDGNKAQMHCPYCDALISFRIFANNLLDPISSTCKHLDDWSHKGEVVKAHFIAKWDNPIDGEKTTVDGRTLDGLLTDIQHYFHDLTKDTYWRKCDEYIAEARASGEKMQAEIVELKVAALEAGSKEKVANVYESAVKREEKNHLNSVIGDLQKNNIARAEEVEKLQAEIADLKAERDSLDMSNRQYYREKEKMQAEINALRGGIEAHKVEAERRWNSCMPPEYINGKDDPEGGKMCPFFDESKYGNCGASDEGCFQDIKQWTQCGTWIETIENIRDKARQTKIEAHNFATARAKYATASLSMDAVKTVDDVINKAAHSIGMEVVPEDEMHKYETLDTPDHTASCVFLPVHINGLMRGHARLPIIGHCVDPDGCAVIVRLGKVDFPLPVDFDPSK